MATATNDTTNKKWVVSAPAIDDNNLAAKTYSLDTAGKYVHQGIEFQTPAVPTATVSGTQNVKINSITVGEYSTSTGTFPVASAAKSVGLNVTTAGYISSGKGSKTSGTALVSGATLEPATIDVSLSDIESITVGSKNTTNSSYPVTSSSITPTLTVDSSGYVSQYSINNTVGSFYLRNTATVNASLPAAKATVTGSATAGSPTIAQGAASGNGSRIAITPTTTVPSSGFYVAMQATSPSATISLSKSGLTKGYLGTLDEITASNGTISSKTGSVYYAPIASGKMKSGSATITSATVGTKNSSGKYPITGSATVSAPTLVTTGYINAGGGDTNTASLNAALDAATFSSAATSGKTYATDVVTTPVLVSGDYLYINAGYVPDIKMSLADLVPDEASVGAATSSASMRSGTSAYNNEGKIVSGSMPNATISSGAVTVSVGDPTYNSSTNLFNLAATGNAAAATVTTAGYISGSDGTKNTSSGSTTKSLAKIGIKAAISGTAKVTPVISKVTKPSADTWTDAASGSATTTKPTSGVYVEVQSAAGANTLTATPSVSSAGYGTTTSGQYTPENATVSAGANASAATYIPITQGSSSVSGKTVSWTTGWQNAGSRSVSTMVPKIGSTNMSSGTGTVGSSTSDQTITIPVGYNETARTITVKGSSSGTAAVLGTPDVSVSEADDDATITRTTSDIDNGQVSFSLSVPVNVTATSSVTTAGYATTSMTATTGTLTKTATSEAVLSLYTGTYTIS